MSCAEFWFCSVNEKKFIEKGLADTCDESSEPNNELISCCVAPGTSHVKPTCALEGDNIFYPLNIKKSCLLSAATSLNIQVSVCKNKDSSTRSSKCFDLYGMAKNDNIDFIAAYNTIDGNRPHGPSGRTSGTIHLSTGIVASSSNSSVGVFSVHGAFMLFAWMFCAPLGIFIVRYKKTESYRLTAHMSIMAFVGSVMLPLILAADKSVEDGSVGSIHGLIGKSILPFVYVSMLTAGHIRYNVITGRKYWSWVKPRGKMFALYFHKIIGLLTLLAAWFNCYTGLVQIGDDNLTVEIVVMNDIR